MLGENEADGPCQPISVSTFTPSSPLPLFPGLSGGTLGAIRALPDGEGQPGGVDPPFVGPGQQAGVVHVRGVRAHIEKLHPHRDWRAGASFLPSFATALLSSLIGFSSDRPRISSPRRDWLLIDFTAESIMNLFQSGAHIHPTTSLFIQWRLFVGQNIGIARSLELVPPPPPELLLNLSSLPGRADELPSCSCVSTSRTLPPRVEKGDPLLNVECASS